MVVFGGHSVSNESETSHESQNNNMHKKRIDIDQDVTQDFYEPCLFESIK